MLWQNKKNISKDFLWIDRDGWGGGNFRSYGVRHIAYGRSPVLLTQLFYFLLFPCSSLEEELRQQDKFLDHLHEKINRGKEGEVRTIYLLIVYVAPNRRTPIFRNMYFQILWISAILSTTRSFCFHFELRSLTLLRLGCFGACNFKGGIPPPLLYRKI